MATTYTSFITALADITVSGVTRKYALNATPPAALSTADLPAQFVWPGGGLNDGQRVMQSGGWPIYSGTLCIAVEPIGQSTAPANYAACVTMVDALDTALETGQHTISLGDCGPLSWSIREEIREIAGVACWCVVATVSTGAA